MKVIIMAGGLGKRVASIASDKPKPLIQIAGKPILQWELECLVRQGFTDIILTVSHMAAAIMDYFGNGEHFGCNISYFYEGLPLGNAGALFKLWESGELIGAIDELPDVTTDCNFLLLNADMMFDVDIHRFVAFHNEHKALASLFTHPNNHPADSGLIVSDGGVVKQWLSKENVRPEWYKNRVNAGLHIINTELLKLSGIKTVDTDHKVDLDRDILKPLVFTGRLYTYDSPEYVKDMGTPERFEQVNADLLSGKIEGRNLQHPQKAIFLDRDGTINKYVGFLRDVDELELIDGVAEAIRRINDSCYLCIIVTNQPIISRGEVTVEGLQKIHNKMETLLGDEGAYIDAIYYCPHHPDKGYDGEVEDLKIDCDCRKPKPGMLLQAAKEFNIDLKSSWMVGDGWRDVECGKNAECRTILITPVDEENKEENGFGQTLTAHSLLEAVEKILSTNSNIACATVAEIY